ERVNQAELHAKEMSQENEKAVNDYNEIMVMKNWDDYNLVKVPRSSGGHGGGDQRLQDMIFRNSGMSDPFKHAAGTRDGAMSILIGIAARNSIESGNPVKISDLTDIELMPKRPETKRG
ncbi:MAG: gfo/Idh/MocA family oxidoreductase, partial [Bacteroidota bacterium]|nr:gfo/Idh/MocA family oxidoreductase [Bacteroidota bacterium]